MRLTAFPIGPSVSFGVNFPNCPVPGCRASKPHADDPIVKGLILQFADPVNMTLWTRVALGELTESICRELEEKKVFAWYTRGNKS